jgi:arylsulfatase A-like enzyme
VRPPPNLVLLVTDQQRFPMHWPDRPGWLRDLTPNDAELRRTGLTFTQAFVNSCMCSPSRATLLTGRMPAEHGVLLTHTRGGARPTPVNLLATVAGAAGRSIRDGVPLARGLRSFARLSARSVIGTAQREEPELTARLPNLATLLRGAGYEVAYRGKWHLTKPVDGGEWSAADARRLEGDYGFAGWEPPDAGEDTRPEHFGGGSAGRSGLGWDEDFTRQAEAFLSADRPPSEPFALVLSLVNPHDVLGYPTSWRDGGFDQQAIRDLGVGLPPTVDERLDRKPVAHGMQKYGQAAYIGALRSREDKLAYVNFYAYLQGLVDEKIGRLLAALGDPEDPASLRSRTVIVRTSDHGEMGLSHGGLRQKMFNVYEETLHVPLVVSNPVLFPRGGETDAMASLVDIVPTMLTLAGAPGGERLDGRDLVPVLAEGANPAREAAGRATVDLGPVLEHARPQRSVRDAVEFTFDDDAAATFLKDSVPPPNHVRCVREPRLKYAVYVDPAGRAESQYELYDLERDPLETNNLVDRDSGDLREAAYRADHERLAGRVAAVPAPDPAP